ncbi:unknown [Acidaminococcus sp. CAG:917]|nr:unknown [Acidaminococcus sp. CAG:917]
MTKKETDYLPLWEPLDKSKETPVKKELTKAEEAEKKRKQKQTEAFKKKYFEYYDDVKISHREDW